MAGRRSLKLQARVRFPLRTPADDKERLERAVL
jgi:hypothetical protein